MNKRKNTGKKQGTILGSNYGSYQFDKRYQNTIIMQIAAS